MISDEEAERRRTWASVRGGLTGRRQVVEEWPRSSTGSRPGGFVGMAAGDDRRAMMTTSGDRGGSNAPPPSLQSAASRQLQQWQQQRQMQQQQWAQRQTQLPLQQQQQQRHVLQQQYNPYGHPPAGVHHNADGSSSVGNDERRSLICSTAQRPCQSNATAANAALNKQKQRVRSILLLAALAFMGIIALDGLLRFNPRAVRDAAENAASVVDEYERRLVDHDGFAAAGEAEPQEGVMGRFLRRLADSLLEDTAEVPHHRTYVAEEGQATLVYNSDHDSLVAAPTTFQLPRKLHTLPLLPKRALQHRQRRELMDKRQPIPPHLREGVDDELYHEDHQKRRRMYPMMDVNGETMVDARRLAQGDNDGGEVITDAMYETGALYQGYGTHYLDLWVGSPPQRQTVIIDTGSSITAFPCSGCDHCGSNPATGTRYHLDDDFDTGASSTYEEKACKRGTHENGKVQGYIPCDLGSCTRVTLNGGVLSEHCQVAVSYAEGSSWSALEGSDVVYPAGPHEEALTTKEELSDAGVGVAMGTMGKEDFDWMDFRLEFGCQYKVTGLFRTQLEDGIMGMDNRKGAFWLQLYEHYKQNGYTPPSGDDNGQESAFNPASFSLCYDRQSLSLNLKDGIGSGALTLGGSDPLLHATDMVFAENVTPHEGWYAVRIKAVFLVTNGGTLSEPSPRQNAVKYVRVNAEEAVINGQPSESKGVIVDSGTTDTYLPLGLQAAFDQAWRQAVGNPEEQYHNNPKEISPEDIKSMPTIMFVLRGHSSNEGRSAAGMVSSHPKMLESKEPSPISTTDVVVAVPATHYMEESRASPGKYTSRVYFTERFGAQSILGSNFLMGHDINFDIGRGRVGFSESHCDYSRYVQDKDAKNTEMELQQLQQEEAQRVASQEAAEAEGNANDGDGSAPPVEPSLGDNLAASGWARR